MRNLTPVSDLLADLFAPDEIHRLLMHAGMDEVRGNLPSNNVPAIVLFSELAEAIERRALWRQFFSAVIEARPRRAEEVAAVAASIGEPIKVAELKVDLERKQLEAVAHLEARAADFVAKSKADLESRERAFRRAAYACYSSGAIALGGGAWFAVWRAVAAQTNDFGTSGWAPVGEIAVLGVVAVTLIIAVARYCFMLGRAFMIEAIKNADRSHAISFGEFYLRAYGSSAQWSEVKDAFQHWNIGENSAFIEQKTESFDPQVLAMAVELAKLLPGTKKGS